MIKFILREAFLSVKKAKGSFLISFISTGIAIFLVTASWFLFDLSDAVQNSLKEKFILNVFLDDNLTPGKIEKIREDIRSIHYISEIIYISKDDAARIFVEETGEDFSRILDYNPLPASFQVFIRSEHFSSQNIRNTFRALKEIDGVSDVVYKNETAENILKFIDESKRYITAAALVLILISIYIMYSTAKLIMKARVDEMETMKLIGAKMWTLKMPVVLTSVFTGLLAGLLSLIIFNLFISSVEDYISEQFSYKLDYFFLLSVTTLTGPVLGVIISILTLRKLTLKI